MGLRYDSSLMADEDCYELLLDNADTGVTELPVEWIRDDAAYFMMNRFESLRPYTPPSDVLEIFRRELDAAYDAGRPVSADDAPAHHRLSIADLDSRGDHPPRPIQEGRLVRDACRRGGLGAAACGARTGMMLPAPLRISGAAV